MSDSPPPEERKRLDAEAKAKEDAEQAALPYKWTQTIKDVDVTIPIPGNIKGRDLDVTLAKNKLKVAIKGQAPFIDVSDDGEHKRKLSNEPSSFSPSCPVRTMDTEQLLGRPPPPHPHRRVHLDARAHALRQRHSHPPRQSQQDGVVAARGDQRAQDRRFQDRARELKSK
jgi:hypothetical protein